MPRQDEIPAATQATAGSVRIEWSALAAPWTALASFARRKPLGAIGGLIVLALVVTALLAPALSPYDPRQIIREANNRVPVHVAPGLAYPFGTDHVSALLAHGQPVPQNSKLVHVEELTVGIP